MTESLLFVLQAALKLLLIFTPFLIMTSIGGHRLDILSKVMAVILPALAAQLVFTGVSGFLGGGTGP